MKRTATSTIVIVALAAAAVAGLLQAALASGGYRVISTPVTLPLALVAIGVIVILLAVPIRRSTRDKARETVDPFYATRVVLLAKASALSGALLTGATVGALVYLLSRSALPGVGSITSAILAVVGSAVLLAAGLIAEFMCRIPPGDDDDDETKKPIHIQH